MRHTHSVSTEYIRIYIYVMLETRHKSYKHAEQNEEKQSAAVTLCFSALLKLQMLNALTTVFLICLYRPMLILFVTCSN